MNKASFYSLYISLAVMSGLGLGVFGCSGSQGNANAGASEGVAGLLPPFPVDVPTGRDSSALTQSVVDGAVTWDKTDGAIVETSHLVITAGVGALEYAVYRHEIGFETTLTNLSVDFTATGGDGAWVCIADYTANRWNVLGPFSGSQVIPVDTGGFLSTSANNFFVAVVAFDGTVVDVASTTLDYESGVAPPSTYVDTMQAIFNANCMDCHNSTNAQNGIILDSYWRAFENADAALTKILADHAPSGSGSMTAEEKALFQEWVTDNKPFGEVVTFTNFVQPMTSNNCSPCHTDGNSRNGVNWDTYENAWPFAVLAWERIKEDVMPKNGPPLPDADKDKWLAWVEQGIAE